MKKIINPNTLVLGVIKVFFIYTKAVGSYNQFVTPRFEVVNGTWAGSKGGLNRVQRRAELDSNISKYK